MHFLRFTLPLLLATNGLIAQVPVFRSTTQLIQVNVVALDRKGKPIADLTKDDFTVTDNGKPQVVSMFAVEKKSERVAPPKLAPGFFTNYRGGTITPNITVILLDTLNTSWGNQTRARQGVAKFLSQIELQDRIAIIVLGRELKMLHDFTDDRQLLLQALENWRGGGHHAGGVNNDPALIDRFSTFPGVPRQEEDTFMQARRIQSSLAALESVGNYLAGTPGRKNVIWVTAGFPLTVSNAPATSRGTFGVLPSLDANSSVINARGFEDDVNRTMRVMNNGNISIYPVDARGLSDNPRANVHHETMREFADRTGGKTFINRNDVDGSIRAVMEETELTYSLAFYPSEDKSDGMFRDIKVKVNRPGVQTRYRKGYIASKAAEKAKDRDFQLSEAAHSPIEGAALTMIAQVVRKDDKLSVHVSVDPKGITFENQTAKKVGRLDLLFMQRDKTGKDFEVVRDTVMLSFGPEAYTKLMEGGLVYKKDIPLNPKADFLRVVVRDSISTLSGTVTATW